MRVGVHPMNAGWLFGGVYASGSEHPDYSEAGFGPVTLPHTVTPLSWGDWAPATWERLWIYRRHIAVDELGAGRVFVDFQGVMTTATVWCNGTLLGVHEGGYLPFSVELTEQLETGDNVLAVRVDATQQDVPPNDLRGGAGAIDYLQPAGIYRDVTLRIVPDIHITDVFARPVDVLAKPRLDVHVTLDAGAGAATDSVTVAAAVLDGSTTIAQTTTDVAVTPGPRNPAQLSLPGLTGITLWSPEDPALYMVAVTVTHNGVEHVFHTRTGFRAATFDTDGFHLNGRRHPIFGLNRHQLFPHLGMAAPRRLQRRDAEILRHELSCTMVRCSHYPQSEHFLDACDELGLMVWSETPGWQHVGGAAFRQRVRRDVAAMVVRDRSRPSVIVWGTRLNESANHPSLYARTGQIARSRDGTRPTTGAMDIHSTRDWTEQVFAYDDYHSVDGKHAQATLHPPLPGVPYLVSEAVGALSGAPRYRWIDPPATLALQGRMHAEVHAIAQTEPGYAGLLGWCAFDYQSRNGGDRIWRALKTPGVADTFRALKPAAGFYAAQAVGEPMIAPAFAWDFGPASPPDGPGPGALAFTNCDQLDVYLGDARTPTVSGRPAADRFPGLAHPPVVLDFPPVDGTTAPPLRIDGLIGGRVVTSLRMSADTADDRLQLTLDDAEIVADGVDVTRFTLRLVDRYGNWRPLGATSDLQASFALSGPATLIADTPFAFGRAGGVAGGFIRSSAGAAGTVTLSADCPGYAPCRASLQTVAGATQTVSLGSGGAPVLPPPGSPGEVRQQR